MGRGNSQAQHLLLPRIYRHGANVLPEERPAALYERIKTFLTEQADSLEWDYLTVGRFEQDIYANPLVRKAFQDDTYRSSQELVARKLIEVVNNKSAKETIQSLCLVAHRASATTSHIVTVYETSMHGTRNTRLHLREDPQTTKTMCGRDIIKPGPSEELVWPYGYRGSFNFHTSDTLSGCKSCHNKITLRTNKLGLAVYQVFLEGSVYSVFDQADEEAVITKMSETCRGVLRSGIATERPVARVWKALKQQLPASALAGVRELPSLTPPVSAEATFLSLFDPPPLDPLNLRGDRLVGEAKAAQSVLDKLRASLAALEFQPEELSVPQERVDELLLKGFHSGQGLTKQSVTLAATLLAENYPEAAQAFLAAGPSMLNNVYMAHARGEIKKTLAAAG